MSLRSDPTFILRAYIRYFPFFSLFTKPYFSSCARECETWVCSMPVSSIILVTAFSSSLMDRRMDSLVSLPSTSKKRAYGPHRQLRQLHPSLHLHELLFILFF